MLLHQSSRADLENANLSIVEAKARINAQRKLIQRISLSGRDTTEARKVLGLMLEALQLAKDRRRLVVRDLALRAAMRD